MIKRYNKVKILNIILVFIIKRFVDFMIVLFFGVVIIEGLFGILLEGFRTIGDFRFESKIDFM